MSGTHPHTSLPNRPPTKKRRHTHVMVGVLRYSDVRFVGVSFCWSQNGCGSPSRQNSLPSLLATLNGHCPTAPDAPPDPFRAARWLLSWLPFLPTNEGVPAKKMRATHVVGLAHTLGTAGWLHCFQALPARTHADKGRLTVTPAGPPPKWLWT